jgi:hypothetical protein
MKLVVNKRNSSQQNNYINQNNSGSVSISNPGNLNSFREINSVQNEIIPKRYISIPQLFSQNNILN